MICYTPGSGGSFDSFAVSTNRTFRTCELFEGVLHLAPALGLS
jgi:hypothetical protein